jgi:hypothetical protein
LTHLLRSMNSYLFVGNQLRDSLLRWLSPPDPSINHNIAYKAHHDGTAQWFFQGSIFNQWKSTGSFLWVHGKRALLSAPTKLQLLTIFQFRSGIRQKCPLVCPSSIFSAVVSLTPSIQFLDHTRYYGLVRRREGLDGLFLFRLQGRR